MLFHLTWDAIDTSEESLKRRTELFTRWKPGPGTFQGFYGFADGSGGVAIVEAASAADLAKTLAPWVPFLQFEARVILPVEEAVKIGSEAAAWREGS